MSAHGPGLGRSLKARPADGYEVGEHVLSAHLDGETVLLHLPAQRYFRLNATGQAVWRGLERRFSPDELAASLTAEFAVERGTARAEVARLLSELEAAGLVRLRGTPS